VNLQDGDIYSVAAANLGNDVHVVIQTKDQGLFYTVRLGAKVGLSVKDNPAFHQKPGVFVNLLNINSKVQGGPWLFESVTCAFIGDTLHICGGDNIGGLHHTCRFSSGDWQANWVEVIGGDPLISPTGAGGGGVSNSDVVAMGAVQCVGTTSGELEVLFITGPGRKQDIGNDGRLFLTRRLVDGTWTKPANVSQSLQLP
jgi:hypothetical protein